MPYSDPERQRRYQRQQVAANRAAFLAGKACVDCGSTAALEVDHLDPAAKESHRIWSWSKAHREAELAKCVVRCRACHQERHAVERRSHGAGGYKRGCRCEVCAAWKLAARARESERKAA